MFTRALMWMAIAIIVFTLAAAFDYRWSSTFAWLIYLVNIGLLVLTLVVGSGVGGVSRWVSIGPLQFQFSEMAKVFMALVLAAWVAGRPAKVESLSTIIGAVLLTAPPLALVLIQPDLGTSLVLGAILVGTLFMAGASIRWLVAGGVLMVALLPLVWTSVLQDYQKQRLISSSTRRRPQRLRLPAAPVPDRGELRWCLRARPDQWHHGRDYLPVQTTDFVFARVGEELGFLGGILVLVLFTLLLWRVLVIGWRCRDPFGLAFAGGVAGMLLFQLMVNAGMVLGVMPITGIPLPFITHGGASLISTALALGLLESIAMRQGRAGG